MSTPGKSDLPLRLDPSVISELACPACKGDLSLQSTRLVCTSCRRAYPIVDGIPVLIVERAETGAMHAVKEDS